MSYSNKVTVFATVPVIVDFVISGLLTDGAVVCLRLLFRESGDGRGSLFNGMIWVITEIENGLSFRIECCSRHTFYSDSGLHDEGRGSVHGGESHRWGSVFVVSVLDMGRQGIRCGKRGHHSFFRSESWCPCPIVFQFVGP